MTRPLRTIFLGDRQSEFSNALFAALLATRAELVGVVDSPPRAGRSSNPARGATLAGGACDFMEYARRLRLPRRRPRVVNSAACRRWLRRLRPDLMLSVGFFGILREETLRIPSLPPVNFHASLLPELKGKHPVARALEQGARRTGITVHVMAEAVDAGATIYQKVVEIQPGDTVRALYERVIVAACPLIARLVRDAAQGRLAGR